MAAVNSLKIEEQVQPSRPRVPVEPPPPKARRRWLPWVAVVLALAVAAVALAAWRRRVPGRQPAVAVAAPSFVPVTRGVLVRSLRLSGVVAAVHFAGVAAPSLRGGPANPGGGSGGPPQLTVVTLAAAGGHVNPGAVVAEFERQQQRNNFEDRQAEYISQTDALEKRRAELDIEREQRQTELIKARADRDGARLENQRNEVISKIDAEKNQQALAEAEATLKMLDATMKTRLQAAQAELKLLEIRRERERLQMENARMNYEKLIVRSPIAGMVVRLSMWKGGQMGQVQEGDQVRPGQVFLQVVNSSEMVVRARVNQLDAGLLRPGAPAEVRLDAYPDLLLPGKVENVSTLAQTTNWTGFVKVFSVLVSIQGANPKLIPDISASADVELERVPDALLVPRGAVVRQAGATDAGFVWIKRGEQSAPRAVSLGAKGDLHWAVRSGLSEGDMVLARPGEAEVAALGAAPSKVQGPTSKPEKH